MENKQKLLEFISASDLEENDRQMWLDFFGAHSDVAVEAYGEIFSAFPEELGWFNQIMKRKKEAMLLMETDQVAADAQMKEIVKEEGVKISELVGKL